MNPELSGGRSGRITWRWQAGRQRSSGPGPGGPAPTRGARVREFLLRGVSTAAGVFLATQTVPGIECRSWQGLVAVALLLGLFNAFVRPLLLLLSLPLLVVTLGLFLWVINAGLLSLAAYLVKPFSVASFWSALGGAAVISVVSMLGNAVLGVRRRASVPAVPADRRSGGGNPEPPGSGGGPVIDV